MAVKYYDIAKRYSLSGLDYENLIAKFDSELKIDILALEKELSPLGLKQTVKLSNNGPRT